MLWKKKKKKKRGQAVQTFDRTLQILSRAFSFFYTLKSSVKCFKSLAESFKGSAAYVEINARPSLLIKGYIKNFWKFGP